VAPVKGKGIKGIGLSQNKIKSGANGKIGGVVPPEHDDPKRRGQK
jgi:hypothetical protein